MQPIMTDRLQDFDPELPEDFDSPHAEYARLRQQCPVAWTEGLGSFWAPQGPTDWIAIGLFLLAVESNVAVIAASSATPDPLDDGED